MPSTRSEVADDDQNRTRGKAPTISLVGAVAVVVEGGLDGEERLVVGGGPSRSALASRGAPRAGVRRLLMHDVYYPEDGPAEKCRCITCIVWAMVLLRNVCLSRRLQCCSLSPAHPPLAGTPRVSKSVEIQMTYLPLRWSDRC